MEGKGEISTTIPDTLSPQELKSRALAAIRNYEGTLGKDREESYAKKLGSVDRGAAAVLVDAAKLALESHTLAMFQHHNIDRVPLTRKISINAFRSPSVVNSYGLAVAGHPDIQTAGVHIEGFDIPSPYYLIYYPEAIGAPPATLDLYLDKLNNVLTKVPDKNKAEFQKAIKILSNLSPKDISKAFKRIVEKAKV